jgi:hypothetical protein
MTQREGEQGRGDDGEAMAVVRQARDVVVGAHVGDKAGGARSSASVHTEGGERREWRGKGVMWHRGGLEGCHGLTGGPQAGVRLP